MAFDEEWANDYMRRLNASMFGQSYGGPFVRGPSPQYVIYDEVPQFQRVYMGAPDDTAAPRYVEPGLSAVYRCTCGCAEVTHQLPGGHCLMPCCADEPCTVKKPDPWLEMVAEITGLTEKDEYDYDD
jgi:hypothetical protein